MKNGDTQSRQRQPPGSLASETIRNKRPPGADISFSISRAPIGDPLPVPLLFSFPSPPPAPSALFFSVIFPTAHLSLLNETGEADGGVRTLSSSSAVLLLCPFLLFFVTGRRMQKKRGLFESQPGDRLSSGTSKGHNSATWNFPFREVVAMVVGASVFYASVYDTSPSPSFSSTIGRCIYASVCFALMIQRVFCFKSPLRSQVLIHINVFENEFEFRIQ